MKSFYNILFPPILCSNQNAHEVIISLDKQESENGGMMVKVALCKGS